MTRFGMMAAIAALALAGSPLSAAVHLYEAHLDGPSEVTPNASPGTGFGELTHDDVAHTLRVQATFSGLVYGVLFP